MRSIAGPSALARSYRDGRAVGHVYGCAHHRVIAVVCGIGGLVLGWSGMSRAQTAQVQSAPPQAAYAPSTLDPAQSLPMPRPLATPPAVSAVGSLVAASGATATYGVTPKLALGDIGYYNGTLDAPYSLSQAYYPTDSLRAAKVARARLWLDRLRSATYPDTDGSEALALAEVAIRAGDDATARRIVDAQLAAASTPLRRSEVLEAGVNLFTDPVDPVDDSVRDAARYAIAAGYMATLRQVRIARFATLRDSLAFANRQVLTPLQILIASTRLKRYAVVVRDMDNAIAAARFEPQKVAGMFAWYFPMEDAVTLARAQPQGSTIPDTLTQFRKAMALSPSLQEPFARAMLPGHPAPPLLAHSWVNTADSLYAPTPRPHNLSDGSLHLIVFTIGRNLAIAERLHEQFPSVHTILMTATDGTLGGELVDLPVELGWTTKFLRGPNHVTFTIGIWSGAKQPNKFGGATPEESPNERAYHADRNTCVIVDGHGIVRKIMEMRSRTDEADIARLLTVLTASSPKTAAASPPASVAGATTGAADAAASPGGSTR